VHYSADRRPGLNTGIEMSVIFRGAAVVQGWGARACWRPTDRTQASRAA
jgi:hypothetical protein